MPTNNCSVVIDLKGQTARSNVTVSIHYSPFFDQPSNFPWGNLKLDPHNATTLKFNVRDRVMFPNPNPKPGGF